MTTIFETINNFLAVHLEPKKPILLGFSGGSDSRALLEILLKLQKKFDFELHLVHVDHGWREESSLEALDLKKEAASRKLQFHLKKISPLRKGNLEAESRTLRYQFFKELYFSLNCQALLLAHHKDDVAETILKRIFEGANLVNLSGIEPVSVFENMRVLRPFFNIDKKQILDFLQENKLSFINDKTNLDIRFLRGKMRKEIFPHLEELFGKEIKNSLFTIGSSCRELKTYLDHITQKRFDALKKGPFGSFIDLKDVVLFELKHLILRIAKVEKLELSRATLEKITQAILNNKADLKIELKEKTIIVDRGYLFVLLKNIPKISFNFSLQEGEFSQDRWKIKISKTAKEKFIYEGWQEFFLGKATITLPDNKYFISLPKEGDGKLRKWWSNNKVPAFLRYIVPVVYTEGNNSFFDFLSGKSKNKKNNNFIITIELFNG
ncbi:MAG: tRNA lysidine(34) synthetase TilS [Chlamydiae bacterium]|nr:tRNA lysidine(34) synthetase TilS [Chlamydiota bacterium]